MTRDRIKPNLAMMIFCQQMYCDIQSSPTIGVDQILQLLTPTLGDRMIILHKGNKRKKQKPMPRKTFLLPNM